MMGYRTDLDGGRYRYSQFCLKPVALPTESSPPPPQQSTADTTRGPCRDSNPEPTEYSPYESIPNTIRTRG
jgi:hypothetical protein